MSEGVDRSGWWWGLAAATALCFALYATTMSRWIGMGDTALLIDDIVELRLNTHVNNHRVAVFVGWLFTHLPFGTIPFRTNLMSVFAGTAAMAAMYAVAMELVRRPTAAVLGTVAVAVVHTVWWHATIVENYAFNGLSLLLTTWFLLRDHAAPDRRKLVAAGVIAGLGFVNHVQMGLLVPALGAYALLRPRTAQAPHAARAEAVCNVGAVAGAWLLGFTPYLAVLAYGLWTAKDAADMLFWAVGGQFTERMFDLRPAGLFEIIAQEGLLQFPSAFVLLIPVGIAAVVRARQALPVHAALAVGFVVNTGFFLQFHTWDRFAFLLPSTLVLAIWGLVGWEALRARAASTAAQAAVWGLLASCVVTPPLVYRALPGWAEDGYPWIRRFTGDGAWNTHRVGAYVANPDKSGWDDMDRFAEALFAKLPKAAMFVDDDSRTYYPLAFHYQRRLQQRRDLKLMLQNSWGFEDWGESADQLVNAVKKADKARREVYFVSLQPPHRKVAAALAEEGWLPEPFFVDEDRWVYHIARRELPEGAPRVLEIETASDFATLRRVFEPGDRIAARMRYLPVAAATDVAVRWRDPSGAVASEKVVTLEPDTRVRVVALPDEVARVAGTWTVEVAWGDVVLQAFPIVVR